MAEDRIRGGGVYVQSTDSVERARMLACIRACGFHCGSDADRADLVLMGAEGTTAVEIAEHVAKRSGIPFALAGDDQGHGLLEMAARSGAVSVLPRATSAEGFRVGLQCTVEVARELNRLRRWGVEVGDVVPVARPDVDGAVAIDGVTESSPIASTRDIEERAELRERLVWATEEGAFELAYQPKVNAGTRAIAGFEALVRWNDPVCGQVSPERFIPLAEEMGLIEAIGTWCVHEACARVAEWTKMGLDPGRVAVNASPVQFQRSGFADWLIETVEEAGLGLHQFELEITEGCLLESEEAIATLTKLAEGGIHIAVDDFGTGYSSLQYLRNLPVHCLKIDRVFVTDLESDASARSLTAAIISLAWNLGFRVVAEGVENAYQWGFLADHGCDEIQGYHYSRPLSPADAERLLREETDRLKQD